MRAVVTGARASSARTSSTRCVARGDEVHVVDDLSTGKRENVDRRRDARRARHPRAASSSRRPEVVFHLAAQADVRTSVERPDFDAEVNVVGTVQRARGRARGRRAGRLLLDGRRDLRRVRRARRARTTRARRSRRTASRSSAAEEYLAGWNRIHGTRHVALRFANVYGPRQAASARGRRRRDLPRAAGARRGDARSSATASQTRDFVYVGDVVDALLAAAGHDGGVFNVGTGVETTVLELHERLPRGRRQRRASRASRRRALGDVRRSVLDVSRAERELGWRAQTLARRRAAPDVGLSPLARQSAWTLVAIRVAFWLRDGARRSSGRRSESRVLFGDAYGARSDLPLRHLRPVGRALVRADRRARLRRGARGRRRSSRSTRPRARLAWVTGSTLVAGHADLARRRPPSPRRARRASREAPRRPRPRGTPSSTSRSIPPPSSSPPSTRTGCSWPGRRVVPRGAARPAVLAGVLGGLAVGTRLIGLALVPALASCSGAAATACARLAPLLLVAGGGRRVRALPRPRDRRRLAPSRAPRVGPGTADVGHGSDRLWGRSTGRGAAPRAQDPRQPGRFGQARRPSRSGTSSISSCSPPRSG